MAGNNDIEMAAPQPTGDQSSLSKYDRLDDPKRASTSDMRNSMLVVAALISATTFAAAINPPRGVWQDDKDTHVAGRSVFGTNDPRGYRWFYICNAAAFSSANLVIIYLVCFFPYFVEIWGAMGCMSLTYGLSTAAVSPPDFNKDLIWFALVFPYILRGIFECLKRLSSCVK